MNIKGWKKFQHFKDRRPPWIKLYRDLLDDPDWHDLDAQAAKSLVMLWLIASEHDGKLPDYRKLAFRLRMTEEGVKQVLLKLSHWLEGGDIETISPGYQGDAPETERETEKSREDAADAASSGIVFEAGVIRLTAKHLDQWKQAFSYLDVPAELTGLQEWAAKQPKWFPAVSGALAKKNRQIKAARDAPQQGANQTYWGNRTPGIL